jgi:hypothetical protein
MLVTENQLDQWVRAHARDAQGLVVELVWRLVAAAVPLPRERRFPLGDSIGQHGPDGRLDADLGFEPFAPDGRSLWEIGTNLDAGAKATRDYKDLVAAVPEAERLDTTFVFVTPVSGTRGWEHTWKPEAQAQWLDERRGLGDWKDVRVIDGTKLVDWVGQFPAVGLWLAARIAGIPTSQVETPEQRWELTRSIGEPPPLVTQLFLANRHEARDKVAGVLAGDTQQAKLDTLYPDQVVDFVCAHLADLEPERRAEAIGRCVIVSGLEAWTGLVAVRQRLVLVADASLDLSSGSGTTLIQRARRNGHAVIFGGLPGGVPDPTGAVLRSPTVQHVEEALRAAGYAEQRAASLAQRSGGNLGSLLRCIQNLSLLPAWADDSAAAELAIAAVLGAWTDAREADRAAVEQLAGNSYGEWIGRVREAARRPGTPLIHQEGRWRFVPRFEGWYALGPRLFDEHVDRLGEVALEVLSERDPQFELNRDTRYAAGVYGKVLAHSRRLRRGLADALALLGSHPRALTSCSLGKGEAAAARTVRALLADPDWTRWAGLDDVLPLLAEAAPVEFLDSLDRMLRKSPEVIDALFAQEGDGITGRSYITGLLWALETLAWDPSFFSRAVLTLGEMAARDPGGRWVNRPSNSLREILLPWLPQTCAPVAQRGTALATLLREQPAVGWKLVRALLPKLHGVSTHTRRPAWRPTIPDDWTPGVTHGTYWAQVDVYAKLAVDAAKRHSAYLAELIDEWASLPPDAREDLYSHLDGEAAAALSPESRQRVWAALVELVTKHRRFADADWALEPAWVDRLATFAERLTPTAPSARHRRLFSDRAVALYEERGNYEEQARRLERRRQTAIAEIMAEGGTSAVISLAETVDAPWRVGVALGQVGASPINAATSDANAHVNEKETVRDRCEYTDADADTWLGGDADLAVDAAVLPALLAPEPKAAAQFAGGFVRGRFFRYGWPWVDNLDVATWTPAELGQFFAFLPFVPETWERAEGFLGNDPVDYWTRVAANPYETEAGLEHAVEAFFRHGRPHAAVDCLARMVHDHRSPEPAVITRALLALVQAAKVTGPVPSYEVGELIKALQADPRTTEEELFSVEWAYLPLLSEHHEGEPKFLAERLATDPTFFCYLIRLVFRPRPATDPSQGESGAPASHTAPTGDTLPASSEHATGTVNDEVDAPQADDASGPDAVDTEVAPAVAENAHRLLREWRVPPGTRPHGDFDGEALAAWMDAMKREAAASGHLEIAMTMAGQALTHVPADPDGLWIHRAAAAVLNARDADDLRDGFRMRTLNARGVHWVDPTGKPEDELARLYEGRADAADAAGYRRLATTMREVAASYTREAERIRAEHRAEV